MIDMYAYLQGIQFGGEISYACAIAITTLFATEILITIFIKGYEKWSHRK